MTDTPKAEPLIVTLPTNADGTVGEVIVTAPEGALPAVTPPFVPAEATPDDVLTSAWNGIGLARDAFIAGGHRQVGERLVVFQRYIAFVRGEPGSSDPFADDAT